MAQIRQILFPSDFTPESDHALGHARFLAEEFGASLTLFHAIELPRREWAAWAAGREEEVWARGEDEARRELGRRAAGLSVPHDVVVRHDLPSQPILADLAVLEMIERTKPDLTVMATHGRRGFNLFFLGSVTEQVVRYAGSPVLCVRQAETASHLPYRRILVPTDLSAESEKAFPMAALLARRFQSELVVLHVLPPDGAVDSSQVAASLTRSFEGLAPRLRVESSGKAWDRIVAAVVQEQADLVVMARRGQDSLGEQVFGSTTDRVLRQASCPVLVA